LVKASYQQTHSWQINKYRPSKIPFDILGAYFIEIMRLRKKGLLRNQYPMMSFEKPYIDNLDNPPVPPLEVVSVKHGSQE
jgi:hypothetical protein